LQRTIRVRSQNTPRVHFFFRSAFCLTSSQSRRRRRRRNSSSSGNFMYIIHSTLLCTSFCSKRLIFKIERLVHAMDTQMWEEGRNEGGKERTKHSV
jgi:hypothetical protein